MERGRTEYDTGEIFRTHGQEYENKYPMFSEQRKAMRAIASCRTSVLGGHRIRCSNCAHEDISYNSCRNNNCPKCQANKRRKWVGERIEELLPVPYFHLIFTISDFFNQFYFSYYKELNNSLFKASSDTLLYFFRKKGGVPAMTSVLHTWGQTMCIHPHVHMLVTGGCLSPDRKEWIKVGSNKYLSDVTELSGEFKKRFLREIKKKIPGIIVPEYISDKDWVVFCKKPFAGAEVIVKYLGRYVYRSAISNRRITSFSDAKVTFEYKDYKDTDINGKSEIKYLPVTSEEFIRRFLQHIPPANFRRIRFYGILAGKDREAKLKAAKELLALANFGEDQEKPPVISEIEYDFKCPQCESGTMEIIDTLLPHGPPFITFLNERKRGLYAA